MNWKFWKDKQKEDKKETEISQYLMITTVRVRRGISETMPTADGMKKFLDDLDKIPHKNIPNIQRYEYKPIGILYEAVENTIDNNKIPIRVGNV